MRQGLRTRIKCEVRPPSFESNENNPHSVPVRGIVYFPLVHSTEYDLFFQFAHLTRRVKLVEKFAKAVKKEADIFYQGASMMRRLSYLL